MKRMALMILTTIWVLLRLIVHSEKVKHNGRFSVFFCLFFFTDEFPKYTEHLKRVCCCLLLCMCCLFSKSLEPRWTVLHVNCVSIGYFGMQKLKSLLPTVRSYQKCSLSKHGINQNIVLHASPTTTISDFIISAFMVHSASFVPSPHQTVII